MAFAGRDRLLGANERFQQAGAVRSGDLGALIPSPGKPSCGGGSIFDLQGPSRQAEKKSWFVDGFQDMVSLHFPAKKSGAHVVEVESWDRKVQSREHVKLVSLVFCFLITATRR